MDYTICAEVLKNACTSSKYAFDLLMPFTSSFNSNRVVLNSKIIEEYSKHHSEIIRTWLNGITTQNFFKIVEIVEFTHIFPDTCRKTYDARLIVSEMEDYPKEAYENLTVFNKDEAINEIRPNQVQIIQQGNGNQATTGDNSQNTKLI